MVGTDTDSPATDAPSAPLSFAFTPPPAPVTNGNLKNIGLALVPFTPVSFSGQDSLYAWGRLALYGTGAALTWQKQRKLSYVFLGAAGLSLVTSLAGNAWGNSTGGTK